MTTKLRKVRSKPTDPDQKIIEVIQADLQQGVCRVMLQVKQKEIIVQRPINTTNFIQGYGTNTGLSFRDELISMNNTWRNNATSISNANIDQQTDYTAQVKKVKYQRIRLEEAN